MESAQHKSKSICVFCGSSPGANPGYMEMATELGRDISSRNIRLVYGGGGSGLMGATATAAHKNGGDVLGIIPDFLMSAERAMTHITHRIVPDMHVRKMQMYDESDAFVVLPGGIGTLEEAVEILSWMRLQLHQKPIAFLSPDGYWDNLLEFISDTVRAKLSPEWILDDVLNTRSAAAALDFIVAEWSGPKRALKPVIPISKA